MVMGFFALVIFMNLALQAKPTLVGAGPSTLNVVVCQNRVGITRISAKIAYDSVLLLHANKTTCSCQALMGPPRIPAYPTEDKSITFQVSVLLFQTFK